MRIYTTKHFFFIHAPNVPPWQTEKSTFAYCRIEGNMISLTFCFGTKWIPIDSLTKDISHNMEEFINHYLNIFINSSTPSTNLSKRSMYLSDMQMELLDSPSG